MWRIDSLGHASWLLDSGSTRILTDPVFRDVFEGGSVCHCPSRQLSGPISVDAVYLSHRHLDHFDPETLASFPKQLPIFAPPDELTIAALKQLGFTDLRIMQPFGRHVLNDVEIFPISSPSESFMECAALFRSPSGSIFNQVDTPLDENRLNHLEQLGRIDVMLAMYACQEFGWFVGRESDPSVAFEHNLRTLERLSPRHVVPAAAGFRFVDSLQHLNHLLFPVSISSFITSLAQRAPRIACLDVLPGDRLELSFGELKHLPQAAEHAALITDDRHLLEHRPVVNIPPLIDENRGQHPPALLQAYPQAVLTAFERYLATPCEPTDTVRLPYHQQELVYAVTIIGPEHRIQRCWFLGPNGLGRQTDAEPEVEWQVTASAFVELCEGRQSCFGARPASRKSQCSTAGVDDLLTHFLLNLQVQLRGEETTKLRYFGLLPQSEESIQIALQTR